MKKGTVRSLEFKPSESQNSQIEKCLQIVNSEGISLDSIGIRWITMDFGLEGTLFEHFCQRYIENQ